MIFAKKGRCHVVVHSLPRYCSSTKRCRHRVAIVISFDHSDAEEACQTVAAKVSRTVHRSRYLVYTIALSEHDCDDDDDDDDGDDYSKVYPRA